MKPIVPGMTLSITETVVDLQDKKKATSMIFQAHAVDKATNEPVFSTLSNMFVRGLSGFERKGHIKLGFEAAPQEDPHSTVEVKSNPNQAFLYRLNGDMNPIHVDPEAAKQGGFEVPLIHGLCTYGFTARALQQIYIPNDPWALQSITGRFTSHVFPGETLIVDSWIRDQTIMFSTKTKERGLTVLKGAAKLLRKVKV